MSQEEVTKSILVADDDLGFLLWSGSILAHAGYSPVPAKTLNEALKWMDEPDANFHLLLIDPSLPGASYLVQTARRKYPRLKVASLGEGGAAADIGADAVISKPANASPDTVSTWVGKIARLLSDIWTA